MPKTGDGISVVWKGGYARPLALLHRDERIKGYRLGLGDISHGFVPFRGVGPLLRVWTHRASGLSWHECREVVGKPTAIEFAKTRQPVAVSMIWRGNTSGNRQYRYFLFRDADGRINGYSLAIGSSKFLFKNKKEHHVTELRPYHELAGINMKAEWKRFAGCRYEQWIAYAHAKRSAR